MINRLKKSWVDISIPLKDGMVHWPDDPPVVIKRIGNIENGDAANLSVLSMGAHSGTHVDAPLHFVKNGEGIDHIPLDTVIGRAQVIEIKDPESIKPEELAEHRIRNGDRILFKTRNSPHTWQDDNFTKDFIFISDAAAEFLVNRGVRLVGIDYLSVGSFKHDGSRVHHRLLSSGVWIIEGLNLANITPGNYDFICLPLRIVGGDGAPARAILRPLKQANI
ncbi:MAG: cyclase family protein [Dehalococcoidales bacterium]|nr:cyclase family protein [Dehalococcoidales bacterium]